ncbi:hypothetical protein H5410_014806 [Solanum commersonii]|uniref:G-patch domain-containing protein n=1 Tax=Solanum commersonii TaxID=4109 RepID=A0A9J5ZRZ2_SOLCO|nr:hypothetical protein H5410_014806 [Solanum commersonii]
MGVFIKECVKFGKIQSIVTLQAASRAIQSGSISDIKKKREALAHKNTPRPYVPVQAPIHQSRPAYALRPHPNLEAINAHAYTSIVEPYAQLFEMFKTTRVLQPVEEELPDPIPHNFDGNKRCTYHSRVQGHDTEDCNDKEYGGLDCLDIDEPDAMTSSAQPIITVQLSDPLIVQTYILRVVVTTLIARNPNYDTKAVPWDYREEFTIHGELSHPILSVNSISMADELDRATFHTVEIMQAVRVGEEEEPDDTKLYSATKMAASEMLKYGYQPKSGLGPKSNGIVEPI